MQKSGQGLANHADHLQLASCKGYLAPVSGFWCATGRRSVTTWEAEAWDKLALTVRWSLSSVAVTSLDTRTAAHVNRIGRTEIVDLDLDHWQQGTKKSQAIY